MSVLAALGVNRSGAAAAEMAMLMPVLLALLFGSVELGNYFYDEHKLLKGVRDGARYAARQQFSNYASCSGSAPTSGAAGSVYENTKLLVRKGKLSSTAQDLLPNWSGVAASCTGNPTAGCFDVTMSCSPSLADVSSGNTMTLGGIYTSSTGAPTVVVNTRLPYYSVLGKVFGFDSRGIYLNARQSAAVAGL
jgi:Flp pilus assembly protein TadG